MKITLYPCDSLHGQGRGKDAPSSTAGFAGTPSDMSDQTDPSVGKLNTRESADCCNRWFCPGLSPARSALELRAGFRNPPEHSHDTGLAFKTDACVYPNLLIPTQGEEAEASVFFHVLWGVYGSKFGRQGACEAHARGHSRCLRACVSELLTPTCQMPHLKVTNITIIVLSHLWKSALQSYSFQTFRFSRAHSSKKVIQGMT